MFHSIDAIPDGKAETIFNALKDSLRASEIELQQMVGFGSDGAAVMVGRKSGVSV